jgi:cytochrome c oxidase subunit II
MDDTSVSPPTPPTPPPSPAGAPDSRNHILRAAITWAIWTVVTVVVLFLVAPHLRSWNILPPDASQTSSDIYSVMFLFTLLSIPVFYMVVIFGFYSSRNFRRSRPAGRPFVPPTRLPLIWVVISVLLVIFLYVYGLSFLNKVDAQPSTASNPLVVTVVGEQWLWNYYYPQYGNAESTVLELPVNRPVIFQIHSIDVQHSFWIPAFGIKQDAVPGEQTSTTVTPNKIGTYVVRCAELCGLYHSYMETPVYVVSGFDFNTWVAAQPTPASGSSSFIQPNALPSETAMRIGGSSTSRAEG